MILKKRMTSEYVLVFLVGLGYMLGVLNTYHRFPSIADIYPNLVSIMIAAFGILYWYLTKSVNQWSLSVLAWTSIFLVILMQPYINVITYTDGMVFNLSVLLFCISLSLSLANVKLQNREKLYQILVVFLVLTAILTVITQIIQYLKLDVPRSIVFPNFFKTRIGGSLAQPNQAAFTISLGVAGLLYLSSISQHLTRSLSLLLPIGFLALGLALTASRTGIILMLVVLAGFSLLFRISIYKKIAIGGTSILLLCIGYICGSELLTKYNSAAISSVERISDGTLSLRWYQLQQAAIMFSDNMLTGVGWGNLLGASVHYAQEIPWFSATAHTHFFISQIAVETGIFGLLALLPFAYILVKNFSIKLSNYQAGTYTMLALFIAYSCSEFPLWLPKYLIVFVVLLSIVDEHSYKLAEKIRPLAKYVLLAFSALLVLGSIYYQFQYRSYSKIHYAVTEKTFSKEEKIKRLTAQNPVFGFEKFDDLFLFYLMSEDMIGLEYKTELADKVLSQSVSYYTMTKAANIYLLAGEKEKALTLYQAACVFSKAHNCESLAQKMSQNAEVGSEDLQWVNMQFQKWRKDNPSKTGIAVYSK